MDKKYKSKIDIWYVVVIALVIALMIYSISLVKGMDLLVLGIIFGLETYYLLSTLFATYYILKEDFIDIRCGLLHIKIKYCDIKSIGFSKNFYSSAALSRDKIEIREKNKCFIMGTTYISPMEKQEVYDILFSKVNSNR
jgi:uncharacterized membrane protein YciS (DUF1049 family)